MSQRVFREIPSLWSVILLGFILCAAAANAQYSLPSTNLNFGNVAVGSTSVQQATISNTGKTSLTVSGATVSGTGFSLAGPSLPLSVPPQQSAVVYVSFAPQVGGSASGSLAIALGSGIGNSGKSRTSSATVALSGTGTLGSLSANPSTVNFGSIQVGSKQSQTAILTNSGTVGVTISQATVSGTGFTMSGLSLPMNLAAGQSVSATVTFAPAASGTASGTATFVSNASVPSLSLSLSGTGATPGQLASSPASVSFGTVSVGSTQTQSATLTNTGGSSLTISQATVTGTGFSVSGLNLPMTLSPGQGVKATIAFAPAASGTASGMLNVASNASSVALSLSGAGAAPGQLAANPGSLSFGTVTVGSTQTQSATLTNTGGSSLTISQATATGTGFSVTGLNLPLTLAPGQAVSATVAFAPTTGGSVSGTLSVSSNASPVAVSLSGAGATQGLLAASPTSVSFGTVPVGSSQTQNATLTNTGGSSLTISQGSVTGTGFSLTGLTLPATLAPGQSVSAAIVFAPTTSGSASGYLSIASNASDPTLGVNLSGSGSTVTGQLSVSPSSMNFGSVTVGSTQSLTGSLTAAGSSVTISSASSSKSQFNLSGLTLPLTIPAGQSVPFTVAFTPSATGSASANITFTSNATTSTVSETASGSGATIQHTVDLSWGASSSSAAAYNVYRASTSGGPYSRISSAASTYYTDGTVQSGQTYYYVTTAVDSSGVESGYSNQVSVQVPTP